MSRKGYFSCCIVDKRKEKKKLREVKSTWIMIAEWSSERWESKSSYCKDASCKYLIREEAHIIYIIFELFRRLLKSVLFIQIIVVNWINWLSMGNNWHIFKQQINFTRSRVMVVCLERWGLTIVACLYSLQ